LVWRENAFDELDIDKRHVRLLEDGWPELAGVAALTGNGAAIASSGTESARYKN
jgi:hypothetical protein